MFGHPTISFATIDATYLRLDCVNDPLTATLTAQNINPVSTGLYSLGDGYLVGALDWERINSNTGAIMRVQGLGTTSATNIRANSNAIGCIVQAGNATSTAYIDIGSSSGGLAVNTCLASAAFAASVATNQTCTIEILGTSGTNLGSAVNVLGSASNATASIQFTNLSSGSMNLGSALIEGTATLAAIIISGDGVFNAGNVRDTGGTMTLSGGTVVNLGTLLGGTLTISGDSSFNFGTIEAAGSAIIGGIGCYNMAHVDAGTLSIVGNDCLNIGAIEGATSSITLTGDKVQNFMAVTTGAVVNVTSGSDGGFCRGLATGSSTVLVSAAGASIQGYFLGRAVTNITASGVGSILTGAVDVSAATGTPGTITMTSGAIGSVLIGSVSAQAGGSGTSTFLATGGGAVVMGHIQKINSTAAKIEAISTASFAGGICFSGSLSSRGSGSFTWGYVSGTGIAALEASGGGAFSHGRCIGNNAVIAAAGNGAFSGGDAAASQISANSAGAFAHGFANGNPIHALAAGAIALGDSTAAIIQATAVNAMQIGPGVNSIASSFQIGDTTGGTGLWLAGGGLPGGTLQNGQIWKTVTTGRMSMRSAGVTLNLYQQSAYTLTYATATATHAARAVTAPLTDAGVGTANATLVAITGTGDDANLDDNFADLVAQINKLQTDAENTAQVLNKLIIDLQVTALIA